MENYEEIRLPWTEWKIVKSLGSGTYGKVYEIERNISGMQEKAALKIISRPKDAGEVETYYDEGYDKAVIIASYENEIRNYLQEYKVMKELQGQSNIVSCEDFKVVPHKDGIGGDIFLRMELLTPLRQILREKTLSEEEIIKLGKDISRALILCERENIIHRDIKPANIMVSRFGDYKLGDFGVSKVMDHATYATAMGTPEYQAPEVVHMEKYDHRADIYSLGITLYWLLNNRKMPFVRADEKLTPMIKEQAINQRYQGEKLPAPKNGSEELKKIVLKACAYSPKDRYASAQEMYEVLESLGKSPSVRNIQDNGEKDPDTGEEELVTEESPTDREIAEYTEYQEEETAGNSWGGTDGTIGKPEENIQQEQQKEEYKEEEEKTVGLETADERQQKKDTEKKEEETVIAPVPVKKKKMPLLIVIIIVSVGVYFLSVELGIVNYNPYFSDRISFFLGFTNHKSEYDEDGNEVQRTYYDLDGDIYYESEYDEAGNEVKRTYYDENGNIDSYYESEYGEAGNKVKRTWYDENRNIESCYEYDEAGNGVKSTWYDENGNINHYSESEYNEAGNKVKSTSYAYDENGNIESCYECDEAGNIVKRTLYDSDGVCTGYIVYEHDSEGNEIGGTCYNADGSINNNYKWDNSDGPIVEIVPEELTE